MEQDHRHIADQIDLIGRNVATFYEPVVADMHQVRMQARQFEQLTESLKSASHSSSVTPDARNANKVLDAATCLRDAIGKARETVSDTRLQNTFDRMQAQCDKLLRYSKELNSLSFLMLVTTANAVSSGFSVDHLVSELREMSRQLNTASSDIMSTLGVVNGVRQETGKVLLDTYQLIDGGLDDFDHSATTQVPGHGEVTKIETPEEMAEKLSADLGCLLPGLVACMQHPDAFAQRCDHVAQATRLLDEELNEDTDLALRKLIGAQLDDICEELNRIQADALSTLGDIAAKGTGTLKLFQHHLKNDARLDEIRAEKQKVTETSAQLTQINTRSQSALAELSGCVRQFDGVERIFMQLDSMREGVRTSSLNADLSERQAKINMPELRSVTKAVGDCATACGATIQDLGDLYKHIHQIFEQIDESEISNAIEVVEMVLDGSHASLNALSSQVETIHHATTDCSDALTKLIDLGNSAHGRIASNVMAVKQLQKMAKDIDRTASRGSLNLEKVDLSVISRVFDGYTIETEREVHRRVLPSDLQSEAALADQIEEQDDDDPLSEFLF